MSERHGRLQAGGRRFAIVVSRTNEVVTNELLDGAREFLEEHGASGDHVEVFWVPGAWELPAIVSRLAAQNRFAAIIALGAIIRGATPHFEFLSAAATQRLSELAATSGTFVSLGVLTTDTLEQALERAGGKVGNAGAQAASAAIEMADLIRQLDEEP